MLEVASSSANVGGDSESNGGESGSCGSSVPLQLHITTTLVDADEVAVQEAIDAVSVTSRMGVPRCMVATMSMRS